MKIGGTVYHKGYPISHPNEADYITEIAHDSLKDARKWIDKLLELSELEPAEQKPLEVTE